MSAHSEAEMYSLFVIDLQRVSSLVLCLLLSIQWSDEVFLSTVWFSASFTLVMSVCVRSNVAKIKTN